MAIPRYADRFTSSDGSTLVYNFPTKMLEWEPSPQALYLPTEPLTGAHYAYDQLGAGLAVKQNRLESIRFVAAMEGSALDTELDNLHSKLYRAGKGKLWTISAASDRRWAWARLAAIPGHRLDTRSKYSLPVSLPFNVYSDWKNESQNADAAFTMDGATETFSITNAGNARVYDAVLTLTGIFVNPRIENTTTGYVLQSSRDGTHASNSKLRFDAGSRRVEFSSDAGATYSGDFANFVRATGQIHLMVLDPGVNNFSVTFGGTPTATLLIRFYPAWH